MPSRVRGEREEARKGEATASRLKSLRRGEVSLLNGSVSCRMHRTQELNGTYVPALVTGELVQNSERGSNEEIASVSVFGVIGTAKLRAASCIRATMLDSRDRTRILIGRWK